MVRDVRAGSRFDWPDSVRAGYLLPARAAVAASRAARPQPWPEEDGIRLGEQPLLAVTGGFAVRPARSWEARASFLGVARSGGPWTAAPHELFLARAGRRHRFLLGKAPLRWGSGRQGSLLLGRSAPTTWQLRWATAPSLHLPGPEWTGTWRGEAFVSYLDDEQRHIANPILAGQRVSWQPFSWFEFTGARTILLGGRGRTRRLTLGDLGSIFIGRGENLVGARPPSDSDQRASWTVRVVVPAAVAARAGLDGVSGFWEYAGEDMIDVPIPAGVAHHYGVAAVRDGWLASGEYVETVSRNRWYDSHTVYRDAHFYRGFPLGLALGPDARSAVASVTTPPRPVRLRIEWAGRTFGVITGNRERRVEWGAAARWDPARRWTVECEWRHATRIGDGREPRAPGFARDGFAIRVETRPA